MIFLNRHVAKGDLKTMTDVQQEIDAYIDALSPSRRDSMSQLRALILETLPEAREVIICIHLPKWMKKKFSKYYAEHVK